jgi:hypothetical protein
VLVQMLVLLLRKFNHFFFIFAVRFFDQRGRCQIDELSPIFFGFRGVVSVSFAL